MAGRPRKSTVVSKQRIGKEERIRRQIEEEKVKVGREALIAPSWLSPFAKKEFKRVVSEAESIGLMDNLDFSVLAIYCNAYSSYLEITAIIKNVGFENIKASDYINQQEKYVKQIMQCSSKLGLATTDRLKLVVPTKEESSINKFLKYVD